MTTEYDYVMSSAQTSERGFDFLFEATAEGIDLQGQIDASSVLARTAMVGAREGFKGSVEVEVPNELAEAATEALSLSAATERLREQLSEKEQLVAEQLAGLHLSVRVLDGEDRRLIVNTYYSGGGVGSRQQEFGDFRRTHRNGTFRATLLGQNALVMYPQWMTGQQMDSRNIVVLILRESGEPNIQIEQRERSWKDRMSRRTTRSYERAAAWDIPRLRELAKYL